MTKDCIELCTDARSHTPDYPEIDLKSVIYRFEKKNELRCEKLTFSEYKKSTRALQFSDKENRIKRQLSFKNRQKVHRN